MFKDVPIRNPIVLEYLNKSLDMRGEEITNLVHIKNINTYKRERSKWVGEEYLGEIIAKGRDHLGFPEQVGGYSYSIETSAIKNDTDPNKAAALLDKVADITFGLQTELCLKKNALFCYYPPGGYISWHNNANASSYNFIFTWSETGNGHFLYRDGKTGKICKIEDRPGWQCKAGYFGGYFESAENLCYHACSTDCDRISIAFVLNRDEMGAGVQDLSAEYISAEY